jgi:4-hydroxybenzoyl-CoA reductase subunit alpha
MRLTVLDQFMSTKQFNVIGKPLRKVDAASKCIGQTIFADDIFLPQMLYAKILRTTRPYARIRNIDTSSAETLDGVKTVLLGRELPITFGILPVSQDEHTLAIDVVRYVGEPVAAMDRQQRPLTDFLRAERPYRIRLLDKDRLD